MWLIRINFVFLVLIWFLGAAEAQHGGHSGGGHGGGGHSAGGHLAGHSSGGHSSSQGQTGYSRMGARPTRGNPFLWMHFAGHRSPKSTIVGDIFKPVSTPLRLPTHPVNSTLLLGPARSGPALRPPVWISTTSPLHTMGNNVLVSPGFAHRSRFLFRRFPCFRSSGCFFNGFTQVCFFEPTFSLFFFSSSFGYSSSLQTDDSVDIPNDLGSGAAIAVDMGTNQTPSSVDQVISPSGNKQDALGTTPTTVAPEPQGSERLFVLILKNGTSHRVTDYWVQDGYIEYVSEDGTRNHIPVESLDLEKTAIENSRRGLTFTVRSAPVQ